MLTSEQIKQFEARADAGEQPTGPWRKLKIAGGDTYGLEGEVREVHQHPSGAQVALTLDEGAYTTWVHIAGCASGVEGRSVTAAQLAAEHLIREATAPLHRPMDANELVPSKNAPR